MSWLSEFLEDASNSEILIVLVLVAIALAGLLILAAFMY